MQSLVHYPKPIPHFCLLVAAGAPSLLINLVHTLLGRVGTDPQIRGSEERPVTSFSLATNSVWKTANPGPGDSEWSHRVDWHNVVVFKPGLRESAYNNVHKVGAKAGVHTLQI